MSIAEFGQHFCAITHSKKVRRFNRRREVKFHNRRLKCKLSVCSTAISPQPYHLSRRCSGVKLFW